MIFSAYVPEGVIGWKHDSIVCAYGPCIAASHSGYGEDVHFFRHIWTDYEITALPTEDALNATVSRHGRVSVGRKRHLSPSVGFNCCECKQVP